MLGQVQSHLLCLSVLLYWKTKVRSWTTAVPHKESVEIVYKSFELAPDAPVDGNPSVYDMLSSKYGMSHEQAVANTNNITMQAKELGLDYYFDRTIQTNTFDAHR